MSEPLIKISPQQSIFLVTKADIKNRVTNWEKNRPVDPLRVKAIQAYNDKFRVHLIDGIVYAWKKDDMLKIYDGWTRYSASSDDMRMLLCLYETELEQDIVYHFLALNSAVPVPSLFIEDTEMTKRKVVTTVVNHFCTKYKLFLSASRRPQRPNFNRDIFTEQLSQIPCEGLDADMLIKVLEETNLSMERSNVKYSAKVVNGRLFLFADKDTKWQENFIKTLDRQKRKSWIQIAKSLL
jgi:hypothetical protein